LPYSTTNWDTAYQKNILGIVVQAYDAIPATCNLASANWPKIDPATVQAGTDVLIIRHAETCVAGVGTCEALTANKLYFQASGCPTEIAAGTRNIFAQQPSNPADPSPFTLRQRDCDPLAPAAPVRKVVTNIYYVRNYARNLGDGIPTLMRSRFDLQGTVPAFVVAEPLVEGIEGFTVELGIDSLSKTNEAINYLQPVSWQDPANLRAARNRGDGSADGAFVHCTTAVPCTLAQLTEVVAVRLHILARAETPSVDHTDTKAYTLGATTFPAFNDKFKRHVFSTTVRLNNVSGRRETP
jgi:type IV pilus assembly protein PilW